MFVWVCAVIASLVTAQTPDVSLTVGNGQTISSLDLKSRPNAWVLTNNRAAGLWLSCNGETALALTPAPLDLREPAIGTSPAPASAQATPVAPALLQGQATQQKVGRNSHRLNEPNYDDEDFDFAFIEMAEQITQASKAAVLNAMSITASGAFKVTTAEYVIGKYPQWNVVHHDDFETNQTSAGWSSNSTQTCGRNPSYFLGGFCKFSNQEVFKTFTGLQAMAHKQVRVQALFHFFDKWDGEFGYMKVNEKTVWLSHHAYCNRVFEADCKGLNVCGQDQYADRLSNLIDVTIDSSVDTVKITFGSNLGDDPCRASWGVDDVKILVLPLAQ